MGLDDFRSVEPGREYPDHEKQEKLEKLMKEAINEFPEGEEPRWDFIEVSPRMTSNLARAYSEKDRYFVRINEKLLTYNDKAIKKVLIHECIHLYLYQEDIKHSEQSVLFTWLCGRLGVPHTDVHFGNWEYEVAQKFM